MDGIHCDPFTFDLECHVTRDCLIHLKQSLMELCHRENLHQVDLLAPAGQKITDREYHAGRRGQKKLDERNRQILADGLTPRTTTFQTQKDFLRAAIEDVAAMSRSREEFQELLLEKYHVTLKISRGRFSYLHPERGKFITGRQLGTQYETEHLLKLFEEKRIGIHKYLEYYNHERPHQSLGYHTPEEVYRGDV